MYYDEHFFTHLSIDALHNHCDSYSEAFIDIENMLVDNDLYPDVLLIENMVDKLYETDGFDYVLIADKKEISDLLLGYYGDVADIAGIIDDDNFDLYDDEGYDYSIIRDSRESDDYPD